MIKKELGANIKKLREGKGYTMQSFADKLGVVRQTVTRYESGNLNMSLDLIKKITDALDVQVEIILREK